MKLFALAASLVLILQSPQPTPTTPQTAKSSIEGVVVRADTNEPLSGTKISISPSSAPISPFGPVGTQGARSTITDKDGKFVVKDLDVGQYRLFAARNGYARQEYGQRAIGRPGVALTMAAGQTIKNVVIAMLPAGVVIGRITNDAGDPLVGIDVTLLRPAYSPLGGRTFNPFATARTNDLGEYRLYWVTPGRYYISANSSRFPMTRIPNMNEVIDDVYGTVYYPGTMDSASAAIIEVRSGADLGIDFRMTSQRTYHVRGRVLDSRTGQPPRNASVMIISRQPNGTFGSMTSGPNYNAATGTFDLQEVLPGSYWVRAMASDEPGNFPISPRNVAQVAVDVSGNDVENLALTLLPGSPISGHIQVEGKPALGDTENFDKMRVVLSPLVPGITAVLPGQAPVPKQDGSFTIDAVAPGEYRVSIAGMPTDYYIKEARLGGSDVLQNGFSMTGPKSERLEVLLSPNGGQIEGDIVDDHGDPVRGLQAVLVPDRDRERRDLFKTSNTDQNGHFTMKGLPPGAYKVFAWEELEPLAYFDPEILRQYELQGKLITVAESSKSAIQVRVIPAGQ